MKLLLPIFEKILSIAYPDIDKLNGEIIKNKLEDERTKFWIVLKSINAEIDEHFGGGILDNVISPEAIALKVSKLNRDWRLRGIRLDKAAYALQVPIEHLVKETEATVAENEELSEIVDTVKPMLNSAVRTAKRVEKIEKENEQTQLSK